ncbi:MAG: ZIP family metal transporter [Sulfolobales archaeon]
MIESLVLRVVAYGLIPTIATILGSALIFLHVSLDERFVDVALGFGSGLMVYVAFVELLIPSIELGGLGLSLVGFTIGFILIKSLDTFVPHARVVRNDGRRNLTLVALAIAIHNIPEGLAVGSTSLHSPEAGLATAIAIAIQDVPEGLIVSLSVATSSGKILSGFLAGVLSAVSELVSAIASLVGLIDTAITLPVLLALSASAMVYVVVHEVAPEIFGHEHDEYATLGFIAGLIIGMIL